MAEEDLIFGKNRHFFGGIEPSNMRTFRVTSAYSDGQDRLKIKAVLPFDTQVEGQQLCTVAGAIIRKGLTGYPADEFDGILIADITEDAEIFDTDVVLGQTYYYAAFPYTKQGVYNRGNSNRAECTVIRYEYLFGYDLNLSDSNPATRVTYPSDVDNASFATAKMNFGGSFSYGGWPSTPGDKFMPKPCMQLYNGQVDYFLNPNDYTKKEDGTTSHVDQPTYGGNAMMQWSKIFVKRWIEGNVYKFRCSDMAFDNDWECWSNYDRNDNQIDHFYTPIYFGSNVSGRLRSISGQANSVSTTAEAEINYAKANGDDWYTEVLADRLLLQDLLVMMAKNTELQNVYGFGRCASGNSSAIGQGTMNTKGLFWGSNDQTSGVKVFGMENQWGNLWRRMAGWILYNGVQKVKITRGIYDGSIASDYNLDGNGYITIDGATPSGTSGGYISGMKTEAFGRLPFQANGSSSTFEADGLWFNNSGVMYAFVGGIWSYALLVGPFCASLSVAASYAYATYGAALSCKPLAS